eukprot:5914210-Lingulodinium_polyedra.AAC.1
MAGRQELLRDRSLLRASCDACCRRPFAALSGFASSPSGSSLSMSWKNAAVARTPRRSLSLSVG